MVMSSEVYHLETTVEEVFLPKGKNVCTKN